MPRSGTTWLFGNLIQHPRISYSGIKENPFHITIGEPVSSYMETYANDEISLDFHPHAWAMDTRQLTNLASYTTKFSICFRNPYEFLESWYNFVDPTTRSTNFVEYHCELTFVNYKKILDRLTTCIDGDILVLYYDDLSARPQQYLDMVMDHLGLEKINVNGVSVNGRPRGESLSFSDNEIAKINTWIDEFAEYVDKDLTHWKK
jgi:hypothetical protein